MKTCTKCGETKALEEFSRYDKAADGKLSNCKVCSNRASKAWREKNREADRARKREYYANNREQVKSQNAAYKAARRDQYNGYHHQRRTRKADNGVYLVTDRDYRRILESPCVACGSTKNIQVDHIIPIARGGRHCVGNLQALCGSCNASKGAKLPIAWRTSHSASGTPHAQGGRP